MGRSRSRNSSESLFSGNGRREIVIAPSILSADFGWLARDLARCRRARAPWIHIDVMDGHFVPNMTMGPPMVKSWRAAEPDLYFDTHLMIEDAMKMAPLFREAGSDLITIHVEATSNAARDIRAIKKMEARAGISIKPGTPVRALHDVLELVDLVLVMTVEPGFGGQPLIPRTLNKVRELDLLRHEHGYGFRLEVDGGINKRTAPLAVAAGADILVAGSAVFNSESTVSENLKGLREAIAKSAPNNGSPARRKTSKKN